MGGGFLGLLKLLFNLGVGGSKMAYRYAKK